MPRRALVASGGLTLASGLFQASIFLASVVVARTFGEAGLGRFAVAQAIGSIAVGGLGSGPPVLALRETSAHGVDVEFLRCIVRLEVVLVSCGTLVATVAGGLLLRDESGFLLGASAGVAYGFLSLLSLVAAVHTGIGSHRLAAEGRIATALLIAVFTIVGAAAGLGVVGILCSLALAGALGTGALLWKLRPLVAAGGQRRQARSLLGESLALCGVGLIHGGYQRVDALVVLVVSSSVTAGIYASAYRVLSPFAMLAGGFGTIFLCRLARAGPVDAAWHELRRRGTRLFAVAVLPVAAVLFAFMPGIIRFVYGEDFAAAVGPARILLVSLVPFALHVPGLYALNAAREERRLLVVLGSSIALELLLMWWLAPRYGAAGAAWAWVLTECWVLAGVSGMIRRSGAGRNPSLVPETARR